MNIFELFGIEPTDDYQKIKKAYQEKMAACKIDDVDQEVLLQGALACVDSPEKLAHYLNQLRYGFSHTSLIQEAVSAPVIQGCIEVWNNKTTVFIPIDITELTNEESLNPSRGILSLKKIKDPSTFQLSLVLEQIADVLTYKSSSQLRQVGQTYAEAAKIVNQHTHHYYTLIVQVAISVDRLHGYKQCEANLSETLNARLNFFPCLLKQSSFKVSDILGAEPMRYYANSRRFRYETEPHLLWPYSSSGQLLAVKNPAIPVEAYPSRTLTIPEGNAASAMTLFGVKNRRNPAGNEWSLSSSCVLL